MPDGIGALRLSAMNPTIRNSVTVLREWHEFPGEWPAEVAKLQKVE